MLKQVRAGQQAQDVGHVSGLLDSRPRQPLQDLNNRLCRRWKVVSCCKLLHRCNPDLLRRS